MRTTRLRQKIKKFLHSRGEANTTEILEHVNTTMRHGTTPQQLGNVLSKDKDIMKVATTKRGGALSGRYEICVWQLRPGCLKITSFLISPVSCSRQTVHLRSVSECILATLIRSSSPCLQCVG